MDFAKFKALWVKLIQKFDCIITDSPENAYTEYLLNDNAIRFARKGKYMPNMEVKFPKAELDKWALQDRRKVILNKMPLFISPIELQLAYKLFLGTEKDIEDARYLNNIFKTKIDAARLDWFNRKLNIAKKTLRYLK